MHVCTLVISIVHIQPDVCCCHKLQQNMYQVSIIYKKHCLHFFCLLIQTLILVSLDLDCIFTITNLAM